MNKIKTIICLITFVFVSATPAEQHIEVRTMREVKQIFTHFPLGHNTQLLSATTQSDERVNFFRLTVSPAGDVTQIRVVRPAAAFTGQDKTDVIMLKTLALWKANPSNTTRIVDIKLRPFFEIR
jgi:hypothetical protein